MRTRLLGGSAASLFAGLGPRVMLAPDDGGGSGGGDGGGSAAGGGGEAGAGAGGAAGAAGSGGGADGAGSDGGGNSGGEPSLLGQGAVKPGTGADADAPPGAKEGDAKPTGDKDLGDKAKPEGEAAKTDEAPKDIDGNALPEAYEFNMPDGFVADQAMLDLATPVFKEHRLSPAQAQAVADLYAKVTKDQVTKHMDTVKGWRDRAKADPAMLEEGGYEKNLGLAHKGFQAFGNEEALQILDTYGLGEHPAILRIFRDIGKAVGETGTIGGDAAQGQRSTADILFPSMRKK